MAANDQSIAQDYRESLEALTENNRFMIANLTVIAKESTEHADAISNVILEHIAKVSCVLWAEF